LLLLTAPAYAPPGRFVPPPRAPTPPVVPARPGGGYHPVPVTHPGGGGGSDDNGWLWGLVCLGVPVLLVVVGANAARNGKAQPPAPLPSRQDLAASAGLTALLSAVSHPGPNEPDVIVEGGFVAEKAGRTARLLEGLSSCDPLLSPALVLAWARETFLLVQEQWQKRDYRPVTNRLGRQLLAEHEGQIAQMRAAHVVNRLEGLVIERMELIHAHLPRALDEREVTVLVTFRERSFYVDERTGAYQYGERQERRFQEGWVLRRQGDGWVVDWIERGPVARRLEEDDYVEETDGVGQGAPADGITT
jgi:predicted lipid-binding transport protein (Tim44 family)